MPALFIGMTGLDEEFRNREIYAEKILYDTRLNSILDTLGNVLTDFGGKGKAFTNVYPIRYPGTWDTNEEQRERRRPGEMDPRPQGLPRIGDGEDLRPRRRPSAGTRP